MKKSFAIMLVGSNFYNLGQFIYHFLTGRLLGKVLYGDLAAIISLIAYFGIIQLALGLTIVKFIAQAKNKTTVSNLIKWFNFWGLLLAFILSLLTLVLSFWVVDFLNIHSKISVYILPIFVFFFSIIYIHRSILQGLLRFEHLALSYALEIVLKIFLTLIFVILGWAVLGAVMALILSVILVFLMTRISLTAFLKGSRQKTPQILPVVKYSFPVFLQGLALNSMYSTDLLLAKHFLNAHEVGIYASLSVLGRIVFFGSTPILQVMFPFVTKRFSKGQPIKKIFLFSLCLTLLISGGLILLYYLVPKFFINILYGSEFLQGAPMLWFFGIFMALLSLSTLFIQFFLSINKTKIVFIFIAVAFLQAILIYVYHSSIMEIIKINILTASLLLGILCVYFAYVIISGSSGLQARKNYLARSP